jgi:hypothetical protein
MALIKQKFPGKGKKSAILKIKMVSGKGKRILINTQLILKKILR